MTYRKQNIKRFSRLKQFLTSAMAMCVAVSLLLVSCSESDEPQPENTLLTINIQAPDATKTRADEGEVSALETENKMYYAWIWVYETKAGRTTAETDTDKPVGALLEEHLGGVASTTRQMSISRDIIEKNKNVDIYVIVNAGSIPSADYIMHAEMTRKEIEDMVYGVKQVQTENRDDFGLTEGSVIHSVPAEGLPMSQCAINKDIVTDKKVLTNETVEIQLQRMVSKIRFVFARHQEVNDVKILGYTLNKEIIPNRQYVFPALPATGNTAHLPDGVGYNGSTMSYSNTLSSVDILPTDKPEQLAFQYTDGSGFDKSTETAQEYVVRLEQAFVNHKPSLSYGLTYLRETDKKLSGTIRYQLGSDEYTAAFEMADEGDFTRNHEYIVYAYFKKSGLTLTVKAMPWDLQTITNEFSNTVSLAEGGMLKWTAGTYFSKDDVTKELILKTDINYPAEFTFNLASPRGCVWHAVLRTKSGNPDAFELRDADGNAKSEGIVDGNAVTLRVHALDQYPVQKNMAELQIVVRCNGITLPVDILTNDKKNFTIIQNKN